MSSPPPTPALSRCAPWLALATALGCYFYLLTTPGTSDVPDYWIRWTGLMREHGLVDSYRIALSDYTPLSFILLYTVAHAADALSVDNVLLLKITIAAFAVVGTFIFGRWSRAPWPTVGFLFALMLNSVAHAYLDVFCLPPLLLSLLALQRRWLTTAALFFSIAMCVKWQPLIIAPFFVIQACRRSEANQAVAPAWRTLLHALGRLSLGTLPVVIVSVGVFGFGAHVASLKNALSHTALSFQGLNLNWIIQLAIYKHQALSGIPYFAVPPPLLAVVAVKISFLAAYTFLAVTLWRKGRTFADFIWCASAGALAYFTLNTGVHENHLHLAMVLSFVLFCSDSNLALPMAVGCGLAANLNLLLFYGLDGRTVFTPVNHDTVTILFSLLNMGLMALCLHHAVTWWRVERPATTG